MTRNPIYDYPEPYANPRHEAQASPRNISLVGRLRLTQPVWLQMGINSATALHILQREPPGTFLVRRSNTRQCQVLCLRLPDNSSPVFVTTYCLHQEPTVISLEGSDMKFPSLLHLIASYCSTPDVLPLPLHLPQPIQKAPSCQQLEAIAHLGLEFWSSSFNTREPAQPTPLGSPLSVGRDLLQLSLLNRQGQNCKEGDPTRDPSLTGVPHGNVGARRQHFKSSIKVQVSTEAASPLSPPAAPPPPIPVWKKKNPPNPPRFPVSCGGSWSSSCHASHQVSSQTTVRSEAYHVPCSNGGTKEREAMQQFGASFSISPVSSSGRLLRVTEEEQLESHNKGYDLGQHPPRDIPTQERDTMGTGVPGSTFSSSEPS
ncbi:ras and Rab interactor 1 [Eublepharis macularius]|uniref:Ras and Rab interactor 1 n=1 Tax=Eublepharis macularius TaxID=481883 RepID=A0AA97JUA5_EUBMA|nr:ras and Rab interactor 1 [Eublepharis macularius]XP_054845515.1 ras and Rab interactor 1 [Eublepharis macularius]XP_054845525.1 ras and Rab interactor 1 [Eublepharis macularius]XP_054845534.1 ras and Rab interactor 1 [Eublepharis macularius]